MANKFAPIKPCSFELDGLDEIIKEKHIGIVAISISSDKHEIAVQKNIDALYMKNPKIKFIVGGRGAVRLKEIGFVLQASNLVPFLTVNQQM